VRKRLSRLVAAAAVFSICGVLFAGTPAPLPRSGRVISSTVSGHGPENLRKSDVWWTYCISADNISYSVLSRKGPAETGLLNNKPIQFSERKNQISVINPRGKSVSLRILRKENSGKCP